MDWLSFREPVSAWTHGVWMLLAIPGTWVLCSLSRGDRLKQAGMLVFGLSMVLCFGGSWLYHSVRLPQATIEHFATLDYIGVHLLIAGTCTPVGLVVLRGAWRLALLLPVWFLALGGCAVRLMTPLPPALSTGVYLVMGWIGCLAFIELVRHLSHAGLRPIWVGGLFYSAGALINSAGWPVVQAGVFGAHELFHLFVMAGSLCHYYLMLAVLVPFRRDGG